MELLKRSGVLVTNRDVVIEHFNTLIEDPEISERS